MLLYRAFLRALGVTAILGLGLGLACKGSKGGSAADNSFNLAGAVKYVRIPLAKDANGVPTGLVDSSVATNLQTLPARKVMVRAYQRIDQTLPDGSTSSVWAVAGATFTDLNGIYSMTLPKDKPLMVEVMSSFDGGNGHQVNVVGDPAGINSTVPAADRVRYGIRKALDGTAPAGNPVPASLPTGDTLLNFTVGLTDKWWLVNPSYDPNTKVAPLTTSAVDETTLPGRTTGTGSRILAIGDSVASFVATYGNATPGLSVDLHYAPGVSEPRGSFIEYDPSVYPLSSVLNPNTYTFTNRYFGSLQGGANDDAWDEGVIFPMLARNVLYGIVEGRTFGMTGRPLFPQAATLPDLSPDQALIEGLANAMAANLLKSPYLADTQGTALAAPVTDIRDLSAYTTAQLTPDSAPALQALAWELILKANSLASPGTSTTWASINPLAMVRFFSAGPAYPTTTPSYETEPLNIFKQLGRLQEARPTGSTEPVDLASIFTDATLTPLLSPFGITWPRPTTGAYAAFATSWGADPNSTTAALPPMTLSMAKAVQVRGVYPNNSEGEVAYAGFTMSADRAYTLTVSASPALASTAELELMLPSYQSAPLTFTGSGGSQRVVLAGNSTTPMFQALRVRMVSPTTLQPDTTVTISLVPVP
ncbi:hypothetical protein GETHPA_23430 [Geothrix rubra]|uniref:Lipoprotein n=1 Tax=Geothrix rubra TaxID=2927977 RepID=A0ABQ5Q7P7_9BACT|nr:hypothetical protein [Geothrix rubra]GLH70810.1 hypothetical protein GETHPA_23430 [Geothrix rubra]